MPTPTAKRDRITLQLRDEDRKLLDAQREALQLGNMAVTDGQLILGVYRRFAGQVAKPARR